MTLTAPIRARCFLSCQRDGNRAGDHEQNQPRFRAGPAMAKFSAGESSNPCGDRSQEDNECEEHRRARIGETGGGDVSEQAGDFEGGRLVDDGSQRDQRQQNAEHDSIECDVAKARDRGGFV